VTRRRVTLPQGPSFVFHTHVDRSDVYISEQITKEGNWEPLETEVICRLLPRFTTFIDLGANIGWYTAIAQRVMSRRSQIFSFEPDPGNFSVLEKNTRTRFWPWPRTILVRSAISDRIGQAELHLSHINQGDHRIYGSDAGRTIVDTPVTTLDAYFGASLEQSFLLKSDTQGSEPRILRGGRRALSRKIATSVLVLEFWPHGIVASGESVESFISELSELLHIVFVIDNSAMKLRRINWDQVLVLSDSEIAPATGAFVDLLLLPKESTAHHAVADLIA
jgi:FkbM family methyltransferase